MPHPRPSLASLILGLALFASPRVWAGDNFVDWRASAARDARWGRNPRRDGANQPVRIFFIPREHLELSNSRYAPPAYDVINVPVLKNRDPLLSEVLSARFAYVDDVLRGDFVTSHSTWLLSSAFPGDASSQNFLKILDDHQDDSTAAPTILINDLIETAIAKDKAPLPLFYLPERRTVQVKMLANKKKQTVYAYSLRETTPLGLTGDSPEASSQLLLPLFAVEPRRRKKADDPARAAAAQNLAQRLARLNLVHGIYPVAHQQNTVSLIPKKSAPWSEVRFGFRDTFDVAFDFIQRNFMGQPELDIDLGEEWISLVNQYHSSGLGILTAGDTYSAHTAQLDDVFLSAREQKNTDSITPFTLAYFRESLRLLGAPTDLAESLSELPVPILIRFLGFVFDEVLPWLRSPTLSKTEIDYFKSLQPRLRRLAKPYFDTTKTARVRYFLNHVDGAARDAESIYQDLFFFVQNGQLLAQDKSTSKLVLQVHLSPEDRLKIKNFENAPKAKFRPFNDALDRAIAGLGSSTTLDRALQNHMLLKALQDLQNLGRFESWRDFFSRARESLPHLESQIEHLLGEELKRPAAFSGFDQFDWMPFLKQNSFIQDLVWKVAQKKPKFLAPRTLLSILEDPDEVRARMGSLEFKFYDEISNVFAEAAQRHPEKVGYITFAMAAVGRPSLAKATLEAWCREKDMERVASLFFAFDSWLSAHPPTDCETISESRATSLRVYRSVSARRDELWQHFVSRVHSPHLIDFVGKQIQKLSAPKSR